MSMDTKKIVDRTRVAADQFAVAIERLPISDNEKRDTFLYVSIVMAAAWKAHASEKMGDILFGFPFKNEDQESMVAEIPQELLDEVRKMLKA